MKTPTLIVRLIGLYLVVQNIGALIQAHKAKAMFGGVRSPQLDQIVEIQIYAAVFLVIGVVAVISAGRLAGILTFDAPRD